MSPAFARSISRPIIPVTLSLIVFAALLAQSAAPISGGDTPRLLDEASRLAAGEPLGSRGTAFLLPHLVLAGLSITGVPLFGYVAVQILLSIGATAALFFLARRAVGNDAAALLAASLWAVNVLAQRFNLFLLSDGLYQSVAILAALAIVRAIEHPRGGRIAVAAIAVLAISICRPQGRVWPFVLAGVLVWRRRENSQTWIIAVALIAAGLALLLFERDYTVQMNLVQYFSSGQVIWGYSGIRMSMPPWTGGDSGGLSSVARYGIEHPLSSIVLVGARMLAELSNVRPFYSLAHNAVVAIVQWPLVLLTPYAWIKTPASTFKTLTILIIAAHLAIVGVAHADWDGRWFLEIAPFIYAWGAAGLMAIARPAGTIREA